MMHMTKPASTVVTPHKALFLSLQINNMCADHAWFSQMKDTLIAAGRVLSSAEGNNGYAWIVIS